MRAVAAAAGLGLVVVVGGSTVTVGGPMDVDSGGVVCAPLPAHGHAAHGVILPTGVPDGVTIDAVSLVAPDGITRGAVRLMTVPAGHVRLMLDAYPPTGQFPDLWPNAVEAIGATVPAGAAVDLVVELEATGDEASIDGVEIVYTAGGRTYVTRSDLALTLRTGGCV